MNFLETMLLYMSLTFAGNVQEATLTTPTPTPTPEIAIVETVTEAPTATPTATPTPSPTPTATPEPTPTITPNQSYAILRYGDRSNEVKRMQERLIELGYLTGKADGIYGFNTRKAVIIFQKTHGLAPDGDAGRVTLTFLYEYKDVRPNPDAPTATPVVTPTQAPEITPAPPTENAGPTVIPTVPPTEAPPTVTPNQSYRTLRYGNRNADVKRMQERLIELGYLTGKADGAYGNQTRAAVSQFQKVHGLSADGTAGKVTLTYLYEYEHVMYNPAAPTPTPEPTPTAVPTEVPPEAKMVLQKSGVVILDSVGAVYCLTETDGVTKNVAPRVYKYVDGRIFVSLPDLCSAIDGWSYTFEGDVHTVTGNGHTAVFTIDGTSFTCQADGGAVKTLDISDASTLFGDTMVSTDVLSDALSLTAIWDSGECTLLLQTNSTAGVIG